MVQGSCRLSCFTEFRKGVKPPKNRIRNPPFVHPGKAVALSARLRMRLGFITAIPQSVHRGSGCYVGIGTLAAGASALGHCVEMIMPATHLGSFLVERYLFNQALRLRYEWNCDAIIGFDLGWLYSRGAKESPAQREHKGCSCRCRAVRTRVTDAFAAPHSLDGEWASRGCRRAALNLHRR